MGLRQPHNLPYCSSMLVSCPTKCQSLECFREHSRTVLPSWMATAVVRWQLSLLNDETMRNNLVTSSVCKCAVGQPYISVNPLLSGKLLTQLHLYPTEVQGLKDDCKVVVTFKNSVIFLFSLPFYILSCYTQWLNTYTMQGPVLGSESTTISTALDYFIIPLCIILSLCGTTTGNVMKCEKSFISEKFNYII